MNLRAAEFRSLDGGWYMIVDVQEALGTGRTIIVQTVWIICGFSVLHCWRKVVPDHASNGDSKIQHVSWRCLGLICNII